MQVFKSKFTADITPHQRAMTAWRNQTCAAVASVRNQLLSLGAVGFSFGGIKKSITDMIRLGAAMQNTRISFETLLGSAEKGNAVLDLLNKFSDVTPFDNDEVIRAGRILLNCGVSAGELTRKLTMLGDIAAGAQVPLGDVVNIYAKAANKGKVQAEELLQLSERGVPVIQAFSKVLGVTAEEVMKLGGDGRLSFGLLTEALASMTAQGGQYFGLMEKQSRSLQGKWDGVRIALKTMAVEIGEKSIPGLTAAVDDLQNKFEELKESGELGQMINSTSRAISGGAAALVALVKYINDNRATLEALGFSLLGAALLRRTISMISLTSVALREAAVSVDFVTQAGRNFVGPLTKNMMLLNTLKKWVAGPLVMAFRNFGAVATTAFIGWEIGKRLAELTNLEGRLTAVMLKMRGLKENAGEEASRKAQPTVPARDLAADRKRKSAISAEAEALRRDIATLEKNGNSGPAGALGKKLAALEKEGRELDQAVADYHARAKADAAKIQEAEKVFLDAQKARKSAEAKNAEAKEKPALLWGAARDGYEAGAAARRTAQELDPLKNAERDAERRLDDLKATRAQYNSAMRALRAAEAADAVESGQKLSEAERVRAEIAKSKAEELEKNKKKLNRSQRELSEAQWRDEMSDRISGWKREMESYSKEIEEAEKKLRRFGLSADADVLKTKEQIARDRSDELLRKKIEAHNQGAKVGFTAEEMKRVNELKSARDTVTSNRKKSSENERMIDRSEQELDRNARTVRNRDRVEKQQDLNREAAKVGIRLAPAAASGRVPVPAVSKGSPIAPAVPAVVPVPAVTPLPSGDPVLLRQIRGIHEVLKKRLPSAG